MHSLDIFGFSTRSPYGFTDWAIPHAIHQSAPDIEITIGIAGADLGAQFDTGVFHQIAADDCLLAVDGAARFRITTGTRIIVEPEDGAPLRYVEHLLLNTAFVILMQQRGNFMLHASAILHDGRCFAFVGPSGAGKSTLATWFSRQGFRLIADDCLPVTIAADGSVVARGGYPILRLWQHTLDGLALHCVDSKKQLVEGRLKYLVPMPAAELGPMPLAAIFALNGSDEAARCAIAPLEGQSGYDTIAHNTHIRSMIPGGALASAHFRFCAGVTQAVPIYNLEMPRGFDRIDAAAGELAAFIGRLNA